MTSKLTLLEKIHYLHRCFRYRFRTEKQQISKLLSYDLKGKSVFDIGCNHGIYIYWFKKAIGPNGCIHAFEPQPELIQEIEKVSKWLNIKSIKLNLMALSNVLGNQVLSRKYIGYGSASIEDLGPNQLNYEKIKIQTTTLDEYCLTNQIGSLAYMKVDVEGHELSVIEGGLKTIKALKPIIQIELRVHLATCDKVIELLSGLGYRGIMLCDGDEISVSRYKEIPSKKFGFVGHRDFIFEPI